MTRTPATAAPRVRHLPGKMQRRQKLATYWLFGLCFGTGLAWFAGLDLLHLPPPTMRVWWIAHGCASVLALLPLGAALPQHLVVTWKARRNVVPGVAAGAGLALLVLTALGLLYGPEAWHDGAHRLHAVLGLALVAVFPLHVWRGRRAAARAPG